jgi:hypothetical protein
MTKLVRQSGCAAASPSLTWCHAPPAATSMPGTHSSTGTPPLVWWIRRRPEGIRSAAATLAFPDLGDPDTPNRWVVSRLMRVIHADIVSISFSCGGG